MARPDAAVLVVGGYGTIGRTVCTELADRTQGEILAAGRSQKNARRFASSVAGVEPRTFDVSDSAGYADALADVGTVVMCLDQDTPQFAKACLERGIDYVDISPTDALLRAIESFDDLARERGATAVLSVGLSPGLTNLFVAEATAELDTVDRADITLLLGIGDAFGPDTVKWTIEDALGDFSVRRDGESTSVTGLTDPRVVEIPGWGRRRAYRANLADQHVLARTTAIPTIESRLCYDSRIVTRYLAVLRRTGLYQPVVSALGVDEIVRLTDAIPFGSNESVINVEVSGRVNGRATRIKRWVRGPDQARATAIVTARVVEAVGPPQPAGVHHIQELFKSSPFCDVLVTAGYSVGRAEQWEEPS
ncbi:KR domain-containing protein (plasmid) [Haloferax mediterranei ATCC 33500]|uniref:KR domain-containing protein n=1 Tax=Haloferax mediterranei (strain ATCC 33500 / DSM 1411 / JCM 8866 / NBRC 14739 / NCIMB 2177 / R-4) TaxID=523841 RepID=I3RAH7_HALMT|nr:saccharopine dehydrogenase NADP-binding domain-containing protein [Haloferax mediterranei]AFK21237.1 putative saccharopine dehydrogenase [Haloferax mediterranei ATCC 33500]AHZ24659.1 saccharopine dehydrogenase [Haloferax mediterranei ATCC 33500]ELZ97433.1 putative saccharopine dehydrogenase [Haloferax mediterranei ATCC 33500]MDX5990274.1 saccharopine dehydrogenase NADP-binding domain-containing protein [Haloferax mediterranei ATCC 33500]QCQ77056.1 KR domain-containing protein [Haloferax med